MRKKGFLRGLKHVLELALCLVFLGPVAFLPLGASRRLGEALGLLAFYAWGKRRRIALENLEHAVKRGAIDPSLSPREIIRRNFINMGRYAAEIIRVYLGGGEGMVRGIRFEGLEHFDNASVRGRGVLIVTGHCCNWELWALSVPTAIGIAHGVARKQSNPYVDGFIVRAREKFGGSVIYKEGALRKTLSVLKEGGTVGVVMDQAVLPDEGVLIDFLGAPAWTTRMPAAVARRTSAAVLPSFIYPEGDGYVVRFLPEIDLGGDDAADTKAMSSAIEQYIRGNPDKWLWIHRRWKRAGTA